MTSVKFISIFLLIAVAVAVSDAYKACKKVRSAAVDENWIKEVGEEAWYLPLHSNCDNCKKNEGWKWMSGRGLGSQQAICWNSEVVTKYGPFNLPFNCKYFRFEEQSCHLDTSGLKGKAKNKVGFGAEHIITLTDNKTFVAGASCIYGKENWWWVATPSETLGEGLGGLDEDIAETAKAHFKKLGFKHDNVATEGDFHKSPLIFKKFTISKGECDPV